MEYHSAHTREVLKKFLRRKQVKIILPIKIDKVRYPLNQKEQEREREKKEKVGGPNLKPILYSNP